MAKLYASRKFLMFLIVLIVATLGWAYALVYKPDQLMTISTFILALLGAYSGANLTDTYLANKKPEPAGPGNKLIDGGQSNG